VPDPTFDRISTPKKANPILSAMQFATQTAKTGGATMNAKSGRLLEPGRPAYVVGGEPNDKGTRVPTEETPVSEFSPATVIQHWNRIRSQSMNQPFANVGSWVDTKAGPNAPVEVDQSGTYADRASAKVIGKHRGEKAIWDNGAMDEIRLDGQGHNPRDKV
jgi:hypothetical protein